MHEAGSTYQTVSWGSAGQREGDARSAITSSTSVTDICFDE